MLGNETATNAPPNQISHTVRTIPDSSSTGILLPDEHPHLLNEFHMWYAQIHGGLSLSVCILGVIMNLAVVHILSRKHMRGAAHTVLISLAISDTLKMISCIVYSIRYFVFLEQFEDTYQWAVFLLFHTCFTQWTHTVSMALAVLLAAYRFIYTSKTSMVPAVRKNTLRVVMAVAIFIIPMQLPLLVFYGIEPQILNISDNETNKSQHVIWQISMQEELTPYMLVLVGVVYKLVPCILMVWFIVKTRISLRRLSNVRDRLFGKPEETTNRQTKNRSSLTPGRLQRTSVLSLVQGSQTVSCEQAPGSDLLRRPKSSKPAGVKHRRIMRMLLVILVIFLTTEIPQSIILTMSAFNTYILHEVYYPLGNLWDMLALMNNAINFAIYCAMSARFRATFIMSCLPCIITWLRKRAQKYGTKSEMLGHILEVQRQIQHQRYLTSRSRTLQQHKLNHYIKKLPKAHTGSTPKNTIQGNEVPLILNNQIPSDIKLPETMPSQDNLQPIKIPIDRRYSSLHLPESTASSMSDMSQLKFKPLPIKEVENRLTVPVKIKVPQVPITDYIYREYSSDDSGSYSQEIPRIQRFRSFFKKKPTRQKTVRGVSMTNEYQLGIRTSNPGSSTSGINNEKRPRPTNYGF